MANLENSKLLKQLNSNWQEGFTINLMRVSNRVSLIKDFDLVEKDKEGWSLVLSSENQQITCILNSLTTGVFNPLEIQSYTQAEFTTGLNQYTYQKIEQFVILEICRLESSYLMDEFRKIPKTAPAVKDTPEMGLQVESKCIFIDELKPFREASYLTFNLCSQIIKNSKPDLGFNPRKYVSKVEVKSNGKVSNFLFTAFCKAVLVGAKC